MSKASNNKGAIPHGSEIWPRFDKQFPASSSLPEKKAEKDFISFEGEVGENSGFIPLEGIENGVTIAKEMEGILEMQQGSGTFVSSQKPEVDQLEKQRQIDQLVTEMLTRASSYGITWGDIVEALRSRQETSS